MEKKRRRRQSALERIERNIVEYRRALNKKKPPLDDDARKGLEERLKRAFVTAENTRLNLNGRSEASSVNN